MLNHVRTQSAGSEAYAVGAPCLPEPQLRAARQKRIWIDIDNSPHVPFFLPIIEELRDRGIELVLTARDMYQVCDLLRFFELKCKIVGGQFGRSKAMKVLCNCLRATQLVPIGMKNRPGLALSHGSRAQVLACRALGIPTVMMHDYEHSTKTGFVEPDWIFMPDVIPDGAMSRHSNRVVKYPGIKEDVYVPRFRPDRSLLTELGIASGDIVVTVRPPATRAHYHTAASDALFRETMSYLLETPGVKTVLLPRDSEQKAFIRREWPAGTKNGRLIIPEGPIDGLNLIWFSDLVISGGGTMNREAAALGVPVYSIFGGRIGAVDTYLAQRNRLSIVCEVSEVRTRIKLLPWDRPSQPRGGNRSALESIVRSILLIAEGGPQLLSSPVQTF